MTPQPQSAGRTDAQPHLSVVIIGAGPGGLACATLLAQNGVRVLVLERKQRVGPKPCGGGITWSGLVRRVPRSLIERAFRQQYIHTDWQRFIISQDSPIIATISREKMGQWMLHQAEAAGVQVRTGMRLRRIEAHRVVVTTIAGETLPFDFSYLVGADGSNSLVRRYLRLPSERIGIGIHYMVPGRFQNMEWHLNTSLFANGYAWIFPLQGAASVGVYTVRGACPPSVMVQRLNQWARQRNIDCRGLRPEAGLINFDYRGWRFGRFMLVGDAAGLASGLTGEGMYPAIVSGEAAARSILDPRYHSVDLNRIIAKQQKHRQVLDFSGTNSFYCRMTMEALGLGLRTGLIPPSMLEMAD